MMKQQEKSGLGKAKQGPTQHGMKERHDTTRPYKTKRRQKINQTTLKEYLRGTSVSRPDALLEFMTHLHLSCLKIPPIAKHLVFLEGLHLHEHVFSSKAYFLGFAHFSGFLHTQPHFIELHLQMILNNIR